MTGLQYNGRAWRNLSDQMKLGYVIGFSEALGACDDEKLPCHLHFDEIVQGVSRIFDEPENTLLTIRMAIHALAMKSRGADPAAVEKELAELRRICRQLQPQVK